VLVVLGCRTRHSGSELGASDPGHSQKWSFPTSKDVTGSRLPRVAHEMAPSSGYNIARLLLIGIAFHVIYIAPVFDCYFRSPVVHGMHAYQLDKPEAKRLVLIVGMENVMLRPPNSFRAGDGLRADMLFTPNAFPSIPDAPKVVAPYLRSIAESRGAYGVSHTRVPTESRPGHVALIGWFS
jgi:phosphatidylinositol glycan class N